MSTETGQGDAAAPSTLSDEELVDVLYGDGMLDQFRVKARDTFDRLSDETGMTAEQRAAEERTAGEFFLDAGIHHEADIAQIHSLMVSHHAKPATPEQVEQWTIESRRYLRETYGADADRRMAAAKQFIAARPALAAKLATSGLGSHPAIISALTAEPHKLRMQPRKRR